MTLHGARGRLTTFAAILAVSFAAGFGIGTLIGDVDDDADRPAPGPVVPGDHDGGLHP